jgi:hypothetical protein
MTQYQNRAPTKNSRIQEKGAQKGCRLGVSFSSSTFMYMAFGLALCTLVSYEISKLTIINISSQALGYLPGCEALASFLAGLAPSL